MALGVNISSVKLLSILIRFQICKGSNSLLRRQVLSATLGRRLMLMGSHLYLKEILAFSLLDSLSRLYHLHIP